MSKTIQKVTALLLALLAYSSNGAAETAQAPDTQGLYELAEFPIGVAVPAGPADNSLLQSPERQAVVERNFNSLTAENIMKSMYLQPERGAFHFADADALVDYAESNNMIVHGHALVWHNQAPEWMNEFEGSADEFRAVLREHVDAVAGHYAGRIESWDVVNEAFDDEKPTNYRDTIWLQNIGPDYIEYAFQLARAADADADLYYNDYNLSGISGPEKLDRVLVMLDDFLARGVPIDGIGLQMHIDADQPDLEQIREAFAKVIARGVKLRISELDVSVNREESHTELDTALAELQRQRYRDVVRIYLDTVPPDLRGGITVWGITDGDSWIPPFKQRPDWPLLFDDKFRNKPAYDGFAEALRHSPTAN